MVRELVRSTVRHVGAIFPGQFESPAPRQEVVLVRPDHLGDAILSFPALRLLRSTAPRLRRTILTGPWNREVFEHSGLAHEVVTLPFPGFTRSTRSHPIAPYRLLVQEAARLRRRAPLAIVLLREDHWWGAWLGALAGIPIRIGADHPAVARFLTHRLAHRSGHVAAVSIELAAAALRLLGYDTRIPQPTPTDFPLFWPVDASAAQRVRGLLDRRGARPPIAVIHPGSGAPAKCWPEARWAALVDALEASGYTVVLTGSADEKVVLQRITAWSRHTPLVVAGELTLRELAELLRCASVVIGPDTGPLHLATAVGTPTVHLFGPTSPDRFGPWGLAHRHRVLRAPDWCPRCGDIGADRPSGVGCMMALSVERVVDELRRLAFEGTPQ
ncbi:MAG: glycosyltransferase family 9 protein [Thermomicrobium sp.]|nr:glycosyltransferase family 9 protein [Thermomicrobium sp.]MDW7982249.1 glycosyltransferase family 9 protein [Thermomicrobium sp.]